MSRVERIKGVRGEKSGRGGEGWGGKNVPSKEIVLVEALRQEIHSKKEDFL